MSSKNKPGHINAQIEIVNEPVCSGPQCRNALSNILQVVFVVKGGRALGFCCGDCYTKATQTYLDQSRANKTTRKKNLLRGLGYKFPSDEELAEIREEAPSS
jgi:hypothetical protein